VAAYRASCPLRFFKVVLTFKLRLKSPPRHKQDTRSRRSAAASRADLDYGSLTRRDCHHDAEASQATDHDRDRALLADDLVLAQRDFVLAAAMGATHWGEG
jgi:hypothetical protein